MSEADRQRIILLNRIVSRSVTRAPEEHKAPLHGAFDLLTIIEQRRQKKWAVEYLNAPDDDNETVRLKNGAGHNFLRLRDCKFEDGSPFRYATLLFEFVDQSERAFPVVDTTKFTGREIEGEENERGATAAHVVIRMPAPDGPHDDGSYRCAIESVSRITRRDIEWFFSKQLRRANDWTFSVDTAGKAKKPKTAIYKYHPRFNLFADIGRRMNTSDDRVLSHMVFTKRSERQSTAKKTSVLHEDIYADVEMRVSARQGPQGEKEQRSWIDAVRGYFKERGFDSRVYYRHINGGVLSGEVHQAVDGAADLMMCPKDIITLKNKPKRWTATINQEIAEEMKLRLNRDGLWERSK